MEVVEVEKRRLECNRERKRVRDAVDSGYLAFA